MDLSKRHLFNASALDGGYDVIATGHNLDDEAAVLLGNVLRWETAYLGRQHPVLPAAPGFVRKVKPLVRLGERETAAYCVLRGIDYQVEECPMAEGNKHLGYKELLNGLEARSPGTKAAFLFGFLERGHERFAGTAEEERRALGECSVCGAPTPARVPARSRFAVPARSRVRSARSAGCARSSGRHGRGAAAGAQPLRTEGLTVARVFAAGDRVLLVDAKRRRHLVTLVEGGQFHTHNGVLEHDLLIGAEEGLSGAHDARRAAHGGAADARRVRARDAARCAGHLPEGPRAHPGARRRVPGCPCPRVGGGLGRAAPSRCCARSAPRVT